MNYFSVFSISGSGMTVEKTRVDVAAVNLANMHSTRSINGGAYQPMRVLSGERLDNSSFADMLSAPTDAMRGAQVLGVETLNVEPRLAFEPGHPDADEKGYVRYPNVDQTAEMLTLVSAVRAYEANLVALNAAKNMALRALEIGDQR